MARKVDRRPRARCEVCGQKVRIREATNTLRDHSDAETLLYCPGSGDEAVRTVRKVKHGEEE